jgi:hypothetical protein
MERCFAIEVTGMWLKLRDGPSVSGKVREKIQKGPQ